MSHLYILVHSPIVEGFRLAGVSALRLEPEQAAEQLETWLGEGLTGLVAIESEILSQLDETLLQRLARSQHLFHVELPGQTSAATSLDSLVKQAVGFSLGFGESE